DFYLSDLDAKALIFQSGVAEPALEVAQKRGIPLVELTPIPEAAGIFQLTGGDGKSPAMAGIAQPEDVALVLHTSGTTSRPKMVPLTGKNLCTSAQNIRVALNLVESDRCLNVMPLFHIHGLIGALLSSLSAGASVVCTPGFDGPKFFDWLVEFHPTWYSAVPTMHQGILARVTENRQIISQCPIRLIRSSSAPLPPQVMASLEAEFNAPVIESYGMTEASHQMASNPLPPKTRKPGSVGVAAGPEVAIMDEQGNLLPVGEVGEVVIRGENVTSGYHNNPDANQSAFTNGWFRTGDLGYLDRENYLFLKGRIKEIINRGGEKISPREVDEVLLDHPAIAQVVTFATPHTLLGEDVAVAVVLQEGASVTEQEIKEFAATRLADFKVPRVVVFIDEIPKGPTGKRQRIGLAQKLGLTANSLRSSPMGFQSNKSFNNRSIYTPIPMLPLKIEAPSQDTFLNTWAAQNKSELCEQLLNHGAILFKNFQLEGISDFEQTIQSLAGDLIPYQDRATPRRTVKGHIYTSTEYPPSHRIFLHNENSFAYTWPNKIFFYCITASQHGGQTPIADIAKVFQYISPKTRAKFLEKGVMYVRNFGNGYGLPWQEAFGTSDPDALEAFCEKTGIELEWRSPQHLKTRQVRPAIVKHPQTGQMVWFNHAAVLHVSTLPPKLQQSMLAEFSLEDLPNNTYYGDGSPIEPDVLDEIRAAYHKATIKFSWENGDVLWLDNLRVAHGREPFSGPRKVVVGMAEPKTWASLDDSLPLISEFDTPQSCKNTVEVSTIITNLVPAKSNYVAPRTPLESVLVRIWEAALNIKPIGIYDNFFDLGGQSLEATDIISEIQETFQISLSLLALNQTPTIAEMTQSLEKNEEYRVRLQQITELIDDVNHLGDAEV
ncbi:MAG: AMP-binding protein, partial [Moorea sp. SIO3G5]|nr:AMP-binding protein [Moorena sp. SIO3G5]